MMNEADDASANREGVFDDEASANLFTYVNWERLFVDIIFAQDNFALDLSDSKADDYGFTDEILMQEMRVGLVEALRDWDSLENWDVSDPFRHYEVRVGNKFLSGMNEQQQQSFFHEIFFLRGVTTICIGEVSKDDTEYPEITICTSALLHALFELNSSIRELRIGNFCLSTQSQVQALSNIILAKRENLFLLCLEGIECPVDYNKRDRDGPIGFLDPLLFAIPPLIELFEFELSARRLPFHSSLVSPKAVRALFCAINQRTLNSLVSLCSLGLNDGHCIGIAEELQSPDSFVRQLTLDSNPAISERGYSALLGLINRVNVVRMFSLDDKAWEAKLNLLTEMNRRHGRLEYLTNGHFTSERRRWEWLKKLASFRSWNRCDETKQVNYLWYELLEHPAFMQT
jgi:hypothetical protein